MYKLPSQQYKLGFIPPNDNCTGPGCISRDFLKEGAAAALNPAGTWASVLSWGAEVIWNLMVTCLEASPVGRFSSQQSTLGKWQTRNRSCGEQSNLPPSPQQHTRPPPPTPLTIPEMVGRLIYWKAVMCYQHFC